jgi:hypothetical protein
MVLKAGKFKILVLIDVVPGEGLLLVFTVDPYGRWGEEYISFMRTMMLFIRTLPPGPNHLPKALPPNHHLGVRISP